MIPTLQKKNDFTCFGESPISMVKNAFYFILKAFFVTFQLLLWLFGNVEKTSWLKINKVNFKIYDVTPWLTNNYKTYVAQYLTKER